jgi:hypothetical protein
MTDNHLGVFDHMAHEERREEWREHRRREEWRERRRDRY